MNADLSIILPARNEWLLARTVEDLLENTVGDPNIIVVCDGNLPDPPIREHPRVTIIYHSYPIGQRACITKAARMARTKWVMKMDAHCGVKPGFDLAMTNYMQPDITMVPSGLIMHGWDWVCPNGHRRYQDPPKPCKKCSRPMTKQIVWNPKPSPKVEAGAFTARWEWDWFSGYRSRPAGSVVFPEMMCLQGGCFLVETERFHRLNLCDEAFGKWGNQFLEVSLKSWLSGGRVVCNTATWYAHVPRAEKAFPYPTSGREVVESKVKLKKMFSTGAWSKQKLSVSWLLKRFWPVPGWTDEDLSSIN